MDPRSIRNIGIAAHIDAGKTTLSERVLYYAGRLRRMGEVHEGNTALDYMEEERKRGITITAAAATVEWRAHQINLIDTPGHVDFTVEVERSMRVLDGAVLVLNGVAGIQAQTEAVWRQMRRHAVPTLVFVNQLDRPGADFLRCCGDLERRLGLRALALQHPWYEGGQLIGVIDALRGIGLSFAGDDRGKTIRELPLPEEQRQLADLLRSELIETLSRGDDEILALALADRPVPSELLTRALRAGTLAGAWLPVLCGSALRNIGVQPLLDAVVDCLPSPLERPAVRGLDPRDGAPLERSCSADGPACALAFKLLSDPSESLTFVRVYSGRLRPGHKLWNPRLKRQERVGRVLRMFADERSPLEELAAGDIGALAGLKFTASGDTLCSEDAPIALEGLELPEPVIAMVFEPAISADRDRLRLGLERLAAEDPTLRLKEDSETGQWRVAGMGELQLEVLRHRLQSEQHLEVVVGKPRVAYREAPAAASRARAEVDRVLAGKQAFGAVELALEPCADPRPPRVHWQAPAGTPAPIRAAIEEALESAASSGPLFGYPLVGLDLRVLAAPLHGHNDSPVAFALAANQALREALEASQVRLMEPVMELEVEAPAEFASGVIADLGARGAEVEEVLSQGSLREIRARVALAQVFGYATALRSLSQGRASFGLRPRGFRPVPPAELVARGLSLD